jgi:hypothetical protein
MKIGIQIDFDVLSEATVFSSLNTPWSESYTPLKIESKTQFFTYNFMSFRARDLILVSNERSRGAQTNVPNPESLGPI